MAETYNTKIDLVTGSLLKDLKVPFTKNTLKKKIEIHPYYPSMFSVHKVLCDYNVENKGMEVDISQLGKLSLPFLAYTHLEEIGAKDFVSVQAVTDKKVTYYYGKEITIAKEEFIANWSKIVLLAEKTRDSKESNYENNLKKEQTDKNRIIALTIGFTALLAGAIYNYITQTSQLLTTLSILLFTLTGVFISILLLIYEIDKSNVFVKNICTGGTKVNCDAVLGSNASKLLGISWGEIGFFFFSAYTIFLLVPAVSFAEKIPYLTYASVLAATYIPFSIYYQYKIVKQWCKLCLFVQGILLLIAIWALTAGSFSFYFSAQSLLLFVAAILIPLLGWYSIKPVFVKANNADKYYSTYKRLISLPAVLQASLSDQRPLLGGWEDLHPIVKGNPYAENIIFKACSPLCQHCFNAHAVFNEVLKKNNNVKVMTVYLITNDADDACNPPVKHFLALQTLGMQVEMEEAMDYWYLNNNRDYNVLKEKYPVPTELLEQQTERIAHMSNWCKAAGVTHTPTVYINGKILPSTFLVKDLVDVF